jgi:TPR repeat protein
MRFRTGLAPAAALCMFALVISVAAQAPAPATATDSDLSSLRQQAAAGDVQAQFALGNRYFRGLDLPLDYGQALFWYRKSAGQGFAPAQNQLGSMYQHKFGIERNYKIAAKLLPQSRKPGLCACRL